MNMELQNGMGRTQLLVGSSFVFMIPSIYTLNQHRIKMGQSPINLNMHFLTVLLFVASVISANFWRNPVPGFRRNLDLVFSKLCFTILVSHKLMYIGLFPTISIETLTFYSIIYFYYLANKKYYDGYNNWIYYHFLFHAFVGLEQFIVISAMIHKK